MNKKFITLCVSALLAGGMVTPAFAADNVGKGKYVMAYGGSEFGAGMIIDKALSESSYYLVRLHTSNSSSAGWNIHLTKSRAWIEDGNEVSQYTLWQVVPVKVNGQLTNRFELVNAAGLKLSVDKKGNVGANKDYSVFEIAGDVSGDGNTLRLVASAISTPFIATVSGTNDLKTASTAVTNGNIQFQLLDPTVMYADKLNDKFLSSFTLGIGYIDNNVWKNHAEEHNFKGNVFTGNLKATASTINTSGYTFKQTLSTGEVYLWNGDKIIVLTNNKWSGLNNSLKDTGYKFVLMTPEELANQEYADANQSDASKRVIRSYVFKIAEPNVLTEAPLEVAAKIYNYNGSGSGTWATTAAWEELSVSEVDDIYYLTTAVSYEDNGLGATNYGYEPALKAQLVADQTGNAYVKFISNNYVSAEKFYSYAWNIVRMSDNKTLNPEATNVSSADEWVDSKTIGMTVPEGQWILRENADKDGYEWANRETTHDVTFALTDPTVDDRFIFSKLRETTSEDPYYGADYYRIGEGDDVEYYHITKAKNAAGVEINLDAYDEFDYYGAGVKSNSAGVDNTYKIQFTSDLTGDPIYIGMDGVGTLMLTKDPAAAVNFEADTVKTTDKVVVVNPEDKNAYNDVFRIFNTYVGKDAKGNWVDKVDTVSFYRYNFMHDGKYLHFNKDANKFELVAPTYTAGVIDNSDEFDAFVIKEKDNNDINILNVDNKDYDTYIAKAYNVYNAILLQDVNGKDYVAGEKLLAYSTTSSWSSIAATQMMYFDFNYGEARQQTNIYNWNANAQLKLDYSDYNIYRNIAPVAPDTVAIYRTEYSDEFLFEKGDFLGMTYDRDGYNAALFVDTAYVRNNTEKPLFMLAVRPEITPAKTYCPIHGVNADCADEHLETIPGYVDADYLTSLADSAAAYAKLLDNPFLANGQYTKLAFVGARHNVDTVTVASTGKEFTITEGLVNPMLFAFRIVNQETQDFVIETADLTNNKAAYNAVANPYKVSYVRWNNGVPVLTDNMADAEVFNVKTDLENANPTANEEIATSSVVVAGTNGAVVVKGAEGKSVIVSTILGKVVANEVLTSDNAQIAAPAGVVVVSVDGESFKVVVK